MKKCLLSLLVLAGACLFAADNMQQQQQMQQQPQQPQQIQQAEPPVQTQQQPSVEFSMPTHVNKTAAEKALRLKIEIADSDMQTYGFKQGAIYTEIVSRLALGSIQVKDDPKYPQLVLRIKSIQADRAVASFIQLGFFEEANLVRNQSVVQALTWSQATMLSCAKEDVVKEVTQVVNQMTNSFILDYQKAMVPQ